MLGKAGATDYRELVTTFQGLKVITMWLIEIGPAVSIFAGCRTSVSMKRSLLVFSMCIERTISGTVHGASAASGGLLPRKVFLCR